MNYVIDLFDLIIISFFFIFCLQATVSVFFKKTNYIHSLFVYSNLTLKLHLIFHFGVSNWIFVKSLLLSGFTLVLRRLTGIFQLLVNHLQSTQIAAVASLVFGWRTFFFFFSSWSSATAFITYGAARLSIFRHSMWTCAFWCVLDGFLKNLAGW